MFHFFTPLAEPLQPFLGKLGKLPSSFETHLGKFKATLLALVPQTLRALVACYIIMPNLTPYPHINLFRLFNRLSINFISLFWIKLCTLPLPHQEWERTKRDFKSVLLWWFNNYSLKSRWIVAEYLPSHYSPRLRRIIVLVYTQEVIPTTFSEGNH